jgi:type III secretion system low calcium response chaperone LcrH/SycD
MDGKIDIKELLDPEKAQERLPALQDYFEQGGTWQQLMGMPDSHLESQYSNGYELYQEGRYEEAVQVFTSLTILNPYQPKFWFSLAASHHLAGDYTEALQAYLLSSAIDEENPDPLMQASRCAAELGRFDEEKELLKQALELSGRSG